jgi:hypothetical protein
MEGLNLAPPPPVLSIFDSPSILSDPPAYFDKIFRLLLRSSHIKRAMLPIFLGYFQGDRRMLDSSEEAAFSQSWNGYLERFPPVGFVKLANDRAYGETVQEGQRPNCRIFINAKLIKQYLECIRLETPEGLSKARLFLLLIVSTFIHESAHGYSFWVRTYGTPYALHFSLYKRIISKEEVCRVVIQT